MDMSKDHKKLSENNIDSDGIIRENHMLKHVDSNCDSILEGKKFVSKLLVSSSSNGPSSNESEAIVLSKQQEKENIEGGNGKRSFLASKVQLEGKDKAAKKGKGAGQGREESWEHEMHTRMERERRKKMRNMFIDLHGLLPQLPSKADKSTIVDEAVNHIKTLESTLQELQNKKQDRQQQGVNNKSREASMVDYQDPFRENVVNNNSTAPRHPMVFQTWAYSNVVLNIYGNEAQFSVFSQKKAGILTTICYVFEKHMIEVLSADITSSCNVYFYMFQGSSDGDELIEPFSQEIYKRAATEINYWLSL